ncbi:MAG: L-methionine gamma-lyase [Owenweeksia sp. TMED14]|nr:MAG: L-methionine gamma-lyase [Owenweeksia sp. TMED14]|tara:strand:+ start:119 stop:1366 length:1248 start_codon:yes stop_codon:yes gene_type:complete
MKKMKPESLMMTHGYVPEWSENAVKCPIYQTSTFVFPTAEAGKRFFALAYGKTDPQEGENPGLIYSRLNNPNLQILEERLSLWEDAEDAAVFESGMSAISTIFLTFLKPGDRLLISNPVYGGTHHFVHNYLQSIGVHVEHFTAETDLVNLTEELCKDKRGAEIKLIYAETPANPTNAVIDLKLLGEMKIALMKSHDTDVRMAIDNTYLGPIWQKPLDWGADMSCYSATKFLSGHSDLIAGAITGSQESILAIKTLRTFLGNMASPNTCWLLTRSLETLSIRMERQASNALHVVRFLQDHSRVSRVYFPGLSSQGTEQVSIQNRQSTKAGAMISFDVIGGEAIAFRVLNKLTLIKLAVSLGSNESLAQHPYHMTHADMPELEKEDLNLTDSMIRLSVGIEDSEDLISDLKQAMEGL